MISRVLRKFRGVRRREVILREHVVHSALDGLATLYVVEGLGEEGHKASFSDFGQALSIYHHEIEEIAGRRRSEINPHPEEVCVRGGLDTVRYSGKNWSHEFRCPACGMTARQSDNFLGSRRVVCDGISFRLASRMSLREEYRKSAR
jgi:hypothetical protein